MCTFHKLSRPLLLTVLVPIVVGLVLLLLVWVAFQSSKRIAVAAQEQQISDMAGLVANSIERMWIAPRNATVKALSTSETLHRRIAGEASFHELYAEWRSAFELLDGYFFIYYGLEDGTVELYPDWELPADFDPRSRPWYHAGLRSEGEPEWSIPYAEIITGEIIISTTMPIFRQDGQRIGVFATDLTYSVLEQALGDIPLPSDASVYLVDENGHPFIGTDTRYIERQALPPSSDHLLVQRTGPLSNNWSVAVVVSREALSQAFADTARPLLVFSVMLFLFSAGAVSFLVLRLGSRARQLSHYFASVMDNRDELRTIYRTHDEFSHLNQQFNAVLRKARLSEEERLSQERVYRHLVEHSPIGFFRISRDGMPVYVNAFCAEMLGYTRSEIYRLSTALQLYRRGEQRRAFISGLIEHGEVRDMHLEFLKKTGESIWVAVTAVVHHETPESKAFAIEGFMVDVSRKVAEHRQLKNLAESDPLTGIANRRAFATAYTLATQESSEVALIFFDLDHFKGLNDTYGHDTGDRLLRHLSEIGTSVIRQGDVFARLGGDEFAILLPGADEHAALGLAERLRDHVRAATPPEGLPAMPTLSIGVCSVVGEVRPLETLLKEADQALYAAKARGGNTVCRHSVLTN